MTNESHDPHFDLPDDIHAAFEHPDFWRQLSLNGDEPNKTLNVRHQQSSQQPTLPLPKAAPAHPLASTQIVTQSNMNSRFTRLITREVGFCTPETSQADIACVLQTQLSHCEAEISEYMAQFRVYDAQDSLILFHELLDEAIEFDSQLSKVVDPLRRKLQSLTIYRETAKKLGILQRVLTAFVGNEWTECRSGRATARLWYRDLGNKVYALKVSGILPVSLTNIVTILTETRLSTKWFPYMVGANVLKATSPLECVCQMTQTLPWPVSNRDFVLENGSVISSSHHFMQFYQGSVSEMQVADLAIPEPAAGVIRAEMSLCGSTFVPLDKQKTYVEIELACNLKIALPGWLILFLSQVVGVQAQVNLAKIAAFEDNSEYGAIKKAKWEQLKHVQAVVDRRVEVHGPSTPQIEAEFMQKGFNPAQYVAFPLLERSPQGSYSTSSIALSTRKAADTPNKRLSFFKRSSKSVLTRGMSTKRSEAASSVFATGGDPFCLSPSHDAKPSLSQSPRRPMHHPSAGPVPSTAPLQRVSFDGSMAGGTGRKASLASTIGFGLTSPVAAKPHGVYPTKQLLGLRHKEDRLIINTYQMNIR